jgi:hypothetical protein
MTATFNTAFETGLARLSPDKYGSQRATHLINLDGDGLLCRPNTGYDQWAPAAPGVAEPDCRKCIALFAANPF